MIAPMKRILILCLETGRESALDRLRALGVLHVTPERESDGGQTHEQAAAAVTAAREALEALHAFERPFHHAPQAADGEDPGVWIDRINALRDQRRHLEEQCATLNHTHHALAPFGNFDPAAIRALRDRGIVVQLYQTRDPDALERPEGVQIHVLTRNRAGARVAAISDHAFELDATPFHLPEQSLADIEADLADHDRRIEAIRQELHSLTPFRDRIAGELRRREDAEQFAKVRDGMGSQGSIVYLRGYAPEDTVPSLREAARDAGWGLVIEDPGPEEDVPTLLRLPRWAQPIQAVLRMLAILPGYHESDISGLFLIFFSIFFAILIGDAGYGALLLLATLYVRYRKPRAPVYPFALFWILSACTIAWGVATGNYFGIAPADGAWLQRVQVQWLTGPGARDHLIRLCFLIGAVHLTLAHVWNAVSLAPALKTLAQLGWIGLVWSMYLTALNMVLGVPYPVFFLPMFIGSVALIVMFMTAPKDLKKDWIQHAMFPLSVVNCFVDIVSYIRLFAVGMASLAVAQSFNSMAAGLGWDRIWTAPLSALILVLGHGLNIILCALGILVHGVRLNTLEFSLHKNIEWKGFPYRPFAGTTPDHPLQP